MKENYQIDLARENTARAMVKNRHISRKYATEICNCLKGKTINYAENFINNIINKKTFLPLKKYRKKVGHKRGGMSGRYPKNASKVFLELLQYAKNNAIEKGLNDENLIIKHIFASQGFRRKGLQPKGRIAGKIRRKKSTHLEIIVGER